MAESNNAFADAVSEALIDPASRFFAAFSMMKIGDPVIFSGAFEADDIDCIRKKSLGLKGAMTKPEFMFLCIEVRRR